ncbi:hypothetical protein [Nocardia grenadensis]|uniref:hypothetical protein n=1 Tax=Nocardia grenadensis TaxID=931537 RepID=UPI003D944767
MRESGPPRMRPSALGADHRHCPSTDAFLDSLGAETVYVTYNNGELVALDIDTGTVLWRQHVTVAAVPVVPTALTVTDSGRLRNCDPRAICMLRQ